MNQSRQSIAIATLTTLFVISILGNIYITRYFLDIRRAVVGFELSIALGLLYCQPCLLSIWCALGGQKPIWRIPASMGMLTVLTLIYSAVCQNDGAPIEITLIICGTVLACTLIIQAPLWVFRAKTKQVIALPTDGEIEMGSSQFGIKHLLITTTIAAISVVIAQATLPNFDKGQGNVPWMTVSLFLAYFVISACLLTFFVLGTIFSQRHRRHFSLALTLFLMTCPMGAIVMISNSNALFGGDVGLETVLNTYCFLGSLAAGIAGGLLIFYAIGFRLQNYSGGLCCQKSHER